MEKESVLIVGGAGYIGAHAAKYLSQKNYVPVVYDNLVYGHRESVKWGPFEEGSIGDSARLNEVMKKYNFTAVMHFAAYAYVGESVTDPQKYYQNNVVETINLLKSMLEHNIMKFIFSSTCAVYGVPERIPIDEDCARNPINPYGMTKLMVERILEDYDSAYGLKSVCLRYFNAAGADPDTEIGENHNPETHLIPLVLDAALGKKEAINVFGDDYPTADGTCVRDYIHIVDLAQAHWQALERLKKKNESLRLNLGNGAGYSCKEVIDSARRVTNRGIKVNITGRRAGDPPVLVGSSDKARSILGWKPEYDSLDNIMKTAWDWHVKMNS